MRVTITCTRCGKTAERHSQSYSGICLPCMSSHTKRRQRAIAAVGRAVRLGQMPPARALLCDDCGKPARDYDHRDYSQPLVVAPTCRSCNLKRGPAAWGAAEARA